jgi:hypothetical protein
MQKHQSRNLWLLKEEQYYDNTHGYISPYAEREALWQQQNAARRAAEQEKTNKTIEELAYLELQKRKLKKQPQSPARDKQIADINKKIEAIESSATINKDKVKKRANEIEADLQKPVNMADIHAKISDKSAAAQRSEVANLDKDYPIGRDCSDRTLRPEAEESAKETGADVETVFKKIKADCEKQHKEETTQPQKTGIRKWLGFE